MWGGCLFFFLEAEASLPTKTMGGGCGAFVLHKDNQTLDDIFFFSFLPGFILIAGWDAALWEV